MCQLYAAAPFHFFFHTAKEEINVEILTGLRVFSTLEYENVTVIIKHHQSDSIRVLIVKVELLYCANLITSVTA
jgi:hypothetical protein